MSASDMDEGHQSVWLLVSTTRVGRGSGIFIAAMGGEATEFNSQESSGCWWGVLESEFFGPGELSWLSNAGFAQGAAAILKAGCRA
ncbi:hypothetical protein, partial [endosymbiont of Riftia pachyptila]|uniref:hypothetical protein n=1 Tax=endosymbiont of Riftia pachyptila TaxID=54396 RepID=UPI001F11EC4E